MSAVPQDVLDIYKMCVEMADRVSARRTTANSFFLTIHAGLLGALGIFGDSSASKGIDDTGFFLLMAGIGGLLLSATWWLLLKSYRDLNSAKFKVINALEEGLPVRPYTDEWQILQQDAVKGWRKGYAEQGTVERVVPGIVAALYMALIVRVLFVA